ncbi:MAG: hypothetical protein FWD13_00860 [Treponema sp.]|nr:hypothetical protein [Treponema sp.]
MKDSFYEQGSIIYSGIGSCYLGGVIGDKRAGEAIITNTRSNAILVSGTGTGSVYVGGFTGRMYRPNLFECYATSDVHAYGSNNIVSAGGFICILTIYDDGEVSLISKCFATGNVFATGNNVITAGGLLGRIVNINNQNTGKVSIKNSYAFGNVLVDRSSSGGSSTFAGGLVGNISDTESSTLPGRHYEINYCYARGEITVKSNGTGPVYAGGIIGYMNITDDNNSGSIKNNASLSKSITAMGSGNLYIGRIYGEVTNRVPAANRASNYAVDTMFLGTANVYSNNPYQVFTPVSIINNAGDKDGQSLFTRQFTSSLSAWTDSTLLNFGSQTGVWNFSIVSRGYPTLNGLGGQ